MPTEYDSAILQVYAEDLYKQARYIIFTTAVRYGFMTFLLSVVIIGASFALSHYHSPDSGSLATLTIFATTFIGIAAGMSEGRRKAFMLKLRAQEVLCQREIEINSRKV